MEDELARVKAENRHLKETIAVLRAELEKQGGVLEEKLEAERSAHRDERKHLQGTIKHLREALEAGKPA